MSAVLSKRLHQALAAYIANGTALPAGPTTLYLALSTADPKDDASGLAEPTGGYARQEISFSATPAPDGGTLLVSTNPIIFGPVEDADWPTVTHGAIFDQAGNLVAFGPLGVQRRAPVADTISFGVGVLQFKVK